MVAERDSAGAETLDVAELRGKLEVCETRIMSGQASDQDYQRFIVYQLELAARRRTES